jgi:hypothetical protein
MEWEKPMKNDKLLCLYVFPIASKSLLLGKIISKGGGKITTCESSLNNDYPN